MSGENRQSVKSSVFRRLKSIWKNKNSNLAIEVKLHESHSVSDALQCRTVAITSRREQNHGRLNIPSFTGDLGRHHLGRQSQERRNSEAGSVFESSKI